MIPENIATWLVVALLVVLTAGVFASLRALVELNRKLNDHSNETVRLGIALLTADPNAAQSLPSELVSQEATAELWETLTKRERQVARLAASGKSNGELANELNITEHTVNTHLKHIFEKLDLHSRLELERLMRARIPDNEHFSPLVYGDG